MQATCMPGQQVMGMEEAQPQACVHRDPALHHGLCSRSMAAVHLPVTDRQVAQNKCFRLISDHYANTSRDALHPETGIPTYSMHSKQLIAAAYEKEMCLPTNHPRRAALDTDTTHRLKICSSLREQGKSIVSELPLKDTVRRTIPVSAPPPPTMVG